MYDNNWWKDDFYSNGMVKDKPLRAQEPQFAYANFFMALNKRISNDNAAETTNGDSWKNYIGLKDFLKSSSDGNFYNSKLGGYFRGLIDKNPQLLSYKVDTYFLPNNLRYLDDWIITYALPRHDVYRIDKTAKNQIINNEAKVKEVKGEKEEKEKIAEIIHQRGRPKGSKNKKEVKPIYMPEHRVRTGDDGKVVLIDVIKALADLVWRNPGLMDGTYLDLLLGLTNNQRKYINKLFIEQSNNLDNKFWKIELKGKTKTLVPLRKRAGYYSHIGNGVYDLVSLTDLANHFGMSKQALQYQLEHKSVGQIIKENKKKDKLC